MMNKELADKLCVLVRQELGSDKFSIITQAVYRKTGSAEPTIVKAVIACMLTAMYAEFLMADTYRGEIEMWFEDTYGTQSSKPWMAMTEFALNALVDVDLIKE